MRLSYRQKFALTFMCLSVTMGATALMLHHFAQRSLNQHILRDFAATAIYRAELAVDYAILNTGDISHIDAAACSPDGRMSLQKAVFVSGTLKDIRLRNGGHDCWAFPGSDSVIGKLVDDAQKFQAQNSNYKLFTLGSREWSGLGIQWANGPGRDVTDIINTGSIAFDILPPDIRPSASVELRLSNGTIFSQYASHPAAIGRQRATVSFEAASERYPFMARLVIDDEVLSSWNAHPGTPVLVAVTGAILLLALLATHGLVRNRGLAGELDDAIAGGEIIPYYQPIMDLKTGRLEGMEMLARWMRPDGSIIAPAQFISLAEENGSIGRITQSLITRAGREVGSLLSRHPHLKLSFNVTPAQFVEQGFAARLAAQLDQAGIPARAAVVEVTERQAITDQKLATGVCLELANAGIRVAIDDAGTGHNGLSALHGLGAQYLKIDKYFVDSLTLDRRSFVLIEMLVSVAAEFGMNAVAEGIETAEQASILADLGVPEGQGYFFSKPLPVDQFLAFAERNVSRSVQRLRLSRAIGA